MKPPPKPHILMSSKDFEKFHPNPLQQQYMPHHVERLTIAMLQFGYLKSQPISVYPDPKRPGHYILNTGHHRLDAAKAAGVSFWFVVEHEWPAEEMVKEGGSHRSWSAKSCAAVWVEKGIPDYLVLQGYVEKGIPISFAGSLLRGECASSGNAGPMIQAGTFQVKSTETADKVAYVLDELRATIPIVGSRVFIAALSALLFTPNFDLERMIHCLRANPSALEKRSTRNDMLRLMEEIYNFRQREKVNIAFQAEETLRNRSAAIVRDKEVEP